MSAIEAAIYCGGPLYIGGTPIIEDLKASGFTTVIGWALHVGSNGDLSFNDTVIVSGGHYIGSPGWPARLANLKKGTTGVNRLLLSVGGAGVQDFENIGTLMGHGAILLDNFQALKSAIPAVDGIDLDDEELPFNRNTVITFSQMLGFIGYQVTFCPYRDPDDWIACLEALGGATPNPVTGINLQCYAGGTGQDPGTWAQAISAAMGWTPSQGEAFVCPGLWCLNPLGGGCPGALQTRFSQWQSSGITSGFIWLYDDILNYEESGFCQGPMDTLAYAQAVLQGLGGAPARRDVSKGGPAVRPRKPPRHKR